ncbi:MAG: hypothetical protein ACRDZ8_04365 [Acidimicrobiales bacterium]
MIEGGVGLEAAAGAATVALAVLALAGVVPADLMAIAVIVGGAGLLIRGASVGSRIRRLMARTRDQAEEVELVTGIGAEAVAGIGGVVLGILALIGLDSGVLVAAAVVAFGAALFIGAGSKRATTAALRSYDSSTARVVTEGDTGAEILIGLGVAVLGILALISVGPAATLSLVGLLALGGGMLLDGVPILGQAFGIF